MAGCVGFGTVGTIGMVGAITAEVGDSGVKVEDAGDLRRGSRIDLEDGLKGVLGEVV